MYAKIRLTVDEKMPGGTSTSNATAWRNSCSNWLEHALNCMIAGAIALDETTIRNEVITRLENYFFNDWRIYLAPYGPGGAEVPVNRRDIDRHQEGIIQGVQYTGFSNSSLVMAFEMARRCGTNLWGESTPEGANYQDLLEQWMRWTYLGEEFHHHLDLQNDGWVVDKPVSFTTILEVAKSNMTMSTAFQNYVNNNRPLTGCERDEFTTLTQGNM